jgi:hypothetical protein
MKKCFDQCGRRGRTILGRAAALFAIGSIALSLTVCFAADPKPDPAGIATGDRTNVIDAGGNAFVITEPDKPRWPRNHWPLS